MRRGTIISPLLGILLVFFCTEGCRQNLAVTPEISEAGLVVFATLDPDSAFVRVLFSHTYSILEELDKTSLLMYGVTGWIECDGKRDTLEYEQPWVPKGTLTGYTSYIARNLRVEPGKIYGLYARYNRRTVTAVTYIPSLPTIERISIGINHTPEGMIVSWTGSITSGLYRSVLGAAVMSETDTVEAFEGFTPVLLPFTRAEVMTNRSWTDSYRDSVTFSVLSMDTAYYAYSVTRQNSTFFDPLSDISFPTRGGAAWNVRGDGIGMFIGRIVARKRTIIPVSVQP